ncbi:DUF2267 domain-containing protein [Myxococcaceae bacterium GXIMD 01537]
MAENTEQSPGTGGATTEAGLDAEQTQVILEGLRGSERLRSLGLADKSEEVLRAVLCGLWRNLPMSQFDILQGMLPGGIDVLVGTCERHRGRAPKSELYRHDAFLDDVGAHLGLTRDAATAAVSAVFDVLLGHMDANDVDSECLYITSPELRALLRCPS